MAVLSPPSDLSGAAFEASRISPVAGKVRQDRMPRLLWPALILVAAGLMIRIAAMYYWGTGTIESEGAEYAKIAENLRNGVGYVGLVFPGQQVHFPPLFPWLIAGASFFTRDYELAARLVALIFGALLPLPVFGIASRLFNRRVGLIAAGLVLLHPLSIYLSFMVYSEGPYATLLLFAVYLVIRAIEDPSIKRWLAIGAAFGICYLVRAESLAVFAISLVFALVATKGGGAIRLQRAACGIAVFLLVASPEIAFLYKSTGHLVLETKGKNLLYMAKRIVAAELAPGVEYVSPGGVRDVPSPGPNVAGGYPADWEGKWGLFGIDSHLRGTGQAMRSFVEVAREERTGLTDALPLVWSGLRKNIPEFFHELSAGWLGAPLLPALALLGMFGRPWRRPQARLRSFLVIVAAAPIAATLVVFWGGDARYYFIFVPILCIWAANGLFEIGRWVKASGAAVGWDRITRHAAAQWFVPCVLTLTMLILPVRQVAALYEFSDSAPAMRADKDVGLWLSRQQASPARIMDLTLPLSFHAGARRHLYFPYCDGDLALRYLDAARVDYIVLRRGEKFTRYLAEWLAAGIPSPRAELLRLPPIAGAENFVIYRWHPVPLATSAERAGEAQQ